MSALPEHVADKVRTAWVWGLVLALLVQCFVGSAGAADSINGALQLSYRLSDIRSGDQERIDTYFLRLYKIGLSKDVTPTVTLSGSFDLSELENNEKRSTSQIPELRLTVASDVVNGNLGYRMVEKGRYGLTIGTDEDRRTLESWNLDMASSALEDTRARMSYRRDRDYDYLPVRQTDTQKDDWFWSIDHELFEPLSVGYSLRLRESDDMAAEVRRETEINEGRLRFRDDYLDGTLSASGSYTHTVSETTTVVGGKTYVMETQREPALGLGRNTTPGPGTALTPWPALIDGDLTTSVGFNIGGAGNTNRNLGLDLDRAAKVDELRVYTTDATFTPGDFTWAVYSSDDGISWALVSASASFSYDDEKDYFSITVPGVEKRFIKVLNVTTDATAPPIYVTELEAYSLGTRASGSTDDAMSVTKITQLGMGYRPIDWVQLSYDLSDIRRMEEAGADETKRDTHNAGIRVIRELGGNYTAAGQYQRRLETQTGEMSRVSDSYLANLAGRPMETVDTDLSLNRIISREGPELVSRNNVAQMHVGALLRQGAHLDLEGGLSSTENLQADSVTVGRNLDANLRLELTRRLTMELLHDMRWSETEQAGQVTEGQSSFSKAAMYFRPSRDVYLRGSYSLDRDHTTGEDTSRQECTLGWVLTRKLKFETGWSMEEGTERQKDFNADLAWSLSEVFNLRFGYDWIWHRADILTEVHQYSMDLTAKF
jgi:hypothetical protein